MNTIKLMYNTNIYGEVEVAKVMQRIVAVVRFCLHKVDVLILVEVIISLGLEVIRRCFSKNKEYSS